MPLTEIHASHSSESLFRLVRDTNPWPSTHTTPKPPRTRTLTNRTLDLCCSRKSGPLSFICYFLFRKRPSDWHMLWTDQSLFVLLLLFLFFFCQKMILMVDKMQVAFHFNIQNRTRSKTESINCMFSDHIWIIWVFISLMIVSPLRSVKNFLLMQKNMRILQH